MRRIGSSPSKAGNRGPLGSLLRRLVKRPHLIPRRRLRRADFGDLIEGANRRFQWLARIEFAARNFFDTRGLAVSLPTLFAGTKTVPWSLELQSWTRLWDFCLSSAEVTGLSQDSV